MVNTWTVLLDLFVYINYNIDKEMYTMITFEDYIKKVQKTRLGCWIYPTKSNFVLYKNKKTYIIKAIFDFYEKEWDGSCSRRCGIKTCINPQHLQNKKEKFWDCVDIKSDDDCWEWKSAIGTGDYGSTHYKGVSSSASRIAWQIVYGDIESEDIFVCHTCDNPPCCNPKHLFLGTRQDNVDDMMKKGRYVNPHCLGESHGGHKLSDVDVVNIRNLRRLGQTYKKIAELMHVSSSCVRDVLKGKNWRHI